LFAREVVLEKTVILARYGLLMTGQSLERTVFSGGNVRGGYFLGTLFEGRQKRPLPNGAVHYPVAVLDVAKTKIRCEVCTERSEDVSRFWESLFEAEMVYPAETADRSLMRLAYTNVFQDDGQVLYVPVFVLNPLFYLFHREKYDMELTEVRPDSEGYVDWRKVPDWRPE
jgi:hypothetical protein